MKRFYPTLVVSVLVAGIAAAADVSAATVVRDTLTQGPASCQAALPVFDGNIRKRPLAIMNEGTSTAFITCGSDDLIQGNANVNFVQIALTNFNSQEVTMTCSLVDGIGSALAFIPKSVTIAPDTASGFISWTAADNNGSIYFFPALSCGLPPGVAISYVRFNYNEEIGS